MKRGFRKVGWAVPFAIACLVVGSIDLAGKSSYRSVMKHWTRSDETYTWKNLESRLQWSATYWSEEFREARREKLAKLNEWTDAEMQREKARDSQDHARYDEFFVSIYSGSSDWPEVGRDLSKLRILLEVEGYDPVLPVSWEPVLVTQTERILYPYLNKWSKAYRARFPSLIRGDKTFRLRLPGIPARSELVWK